MGEGASFPCLVIPRIQTDLRPPGVLTFATELVGILVCKVGMTVPPRHAVVPPAPPLGVTLPARLTSALIVHFYGSEYLSARVP